MTLEKPRDRVGQTGNILIVDDTSANLQVLAGMLKERGYKVRPVPSGKLALLAAQRDPPDLILLDINMPEMNGYEVCEHLKADEKLKGIPVIFLSALIEPLDKVKAFAVGGVDYLSKPFQMEELYARAETHLQLRRQQTELEEYSLYLELGRERLKLDMKVERGVQRSTLASSQAQLDAARDELTMLRAANVDALEAGESDRTQRMGSERAGRDNHAAQPASILVVDDTAANLQVLAGMLKDRGYKVRPVPSGKLALLAAQRDPPDLILLDINMPEMNGYEVCEHLKADRKLRGIPIIFISALTEPLDKVKAFAMGGVDYLTKPFQMEELHARVETHLKLRRLQVELEEYSRDLELMRERLDLDLKWARLMQRSFLPQRLPEVPGYEFFGYYESAFEVGGDYYDFIPLPGGRIGILLGDVAGKGVVAALLMAKLSADARFCMLTEPEPAAAITKLNSLMNEPGIADRFVTLVAAILDPATHRVTLVNAGHPPPLIHHHAMLRVEEAMSSELAGVPLGVVEGFKYSSCQVILEPGDSILAFTDGVPEAMNLDDTLFEMGGVYAALQGETHSPRALGERVVKVVKEFSAGRSQHDDIAVVGFGRV